MKNISLIIFLGSLLLLTGCGGGKTSETTLIVSSSMLMSNTVFSGGLTIQGYGPNNETFSHLIPYNNSSTTSGGQIDILLSKGT